MQNVQQLVSKSSQLYEITQQRHASELRVAALMVMLLSQAAVAVAEYDLSKGVLQSGLSSACNCDAQDEQMVSSCIYTLSMCDY